MKRYILVFGTIFWTLAIFSQTVSIPDTAFLNALIADGVDTNNDSLISYEEAEDITRLRIDGSMFSVKISDLTGIEAFVNLRYLICPRNQITELDASNFKNLTLLEIYENQLTELDVSNLPMLQMVVCFQNKLTNLNVSNCPELHTLDCENNQLTSIDLSTNYGLLDLNCSDNLLTSIDLSRNRNLMVKLFDDWETSLLLKNMPTLESVCVWTLPFPPEGRNNLSYSGSPNVDFNTDCMDERYIPIPSKYAEWIVENEQINGDGYPSKFNKYRSYVNGDTIVNDTIYTKFISGNWGKYYLYQDIIQEKVYYTRHPGHDPHQLLYDFSLSEGQIIDTYEWEYLTVVSVDSIIISGVKRKRIAFNEYVRNDLNHERLCFIEGIGSNAGIFPDKYLGIFTSTLTCFQERGVPVYPTTIHESGCDLNEIIIAGINRSYTNDIIIYPNPFIDNININGDLLEAKITTIKIFNLLGVLEYTSTISLSENNEIELSFLNRGVYILKLERDNENPQTKVIVKR